MTSRSRGIRICYQKQFLLFCQAARPFARILVCCFALGRSLLAYAWPWHCAGLTLAFRNIIRRVVVFWHGFFFLFAELVQYKNTVPSRYATHSSTLVAPHKTPHTYTLLPLVPYLSHSPWYTTHTVLCFKQPVRCVHWWRWSLFFPCWIGWDVNVQHKNNMLHML